MEDSSFDLEELWERLLSREAGQVRAAFAALPPEDQKTVRAHLQRMASEPDWHPEQRLSAQAALQALES